MRIGVIQLCSQLDYEKNLVVIKRFLSQAKESNVEAVFLPECFYSMSNGVHPTSFLVEKNNEHYENIRNLAVEFQLYILGGSAATKTHGNKIANRVYNFSPKGEDLGSYDKMHLFSCNINRNGVVKKINEADIYIPGDTPLLIEVEKIRIGLGVCVDLRYSFFANQYKFQGAHLLTYCSAFTIPTGKAHWHTLLRARAIENQCYIVAPAQWGSHNEKIQTYGHSLIIDPWGVVLADAKEGEKLITADIDLDKIQEVEETVIMSQNPQL